MPWCVGDKEIIHTIKFSEGDGMGWALKYGLYVALDPVSVGDLALREHRDSKKEFMDKIWCYWAPLFLILSVFNTVGLIKIQSLLKRTCIGYFSTQRNVHVHSLTFCKG